MVAHNVLSERHAGQYPSQSVEPTLLLLLKLWTLAFGDSTTALRSFSLLASLLLLPVVYHIGRETVGRVAALIAVALLVLSPLQLYFAQEARVYMLATLLAALTTAGYLDWRAIAVRELTDGTKLPTARRPLLVYSLAAIASLYTLPLVAMLYAVLAADGVFVIAQRWPGVTGEIRRAVARPVGERAGRNRSGLPPSALGCRYECGSEQPSVAWADGNRGGDRGTFSSFLWFLYTAYYFYPWHLYPAIVDKWGHAVVLRLVVVFPLLILALVTAFAYPPRGSLRGPARVLYWGLLVPPGASARSVSIWHELSLTRSSCSSVPSSVSLVGAGIVPRAAVGSRARLRGDSLGCRVRLDSIPDDQRAAILTSGQWPRW